MKKGLIIYVALLISLVCITGCSIKKEENNKKTLYKMKIENLPYYDEHIRTYKYSDLSGNKFTFMIKSEDGSCFYYRTKKTQQTTTQENFRTCNYVIDNNKLTLSLNIKKMVWENSDSDKFIVDIYQDVMLYGEFDDVSKKLSLNIDDKEYVLINSSYKKMLDNNMKYALYNKETKTFYDLNGLSIHKNEYDEEKNINIKTKLDLNKYQIKSIDKLNENESNNNYIEDSLENTKNDNNYETEIESNISKDKKEAEYYAKTYIEELKKQYGTLGYTFEDILNLYGYSSETELFNSIVESYMNGN